VELLEEPTPVQTIADRAEVSRATADDELEHRLTELREDVNDFRYHPLSRFGFGSEGTTVHSLMCRRQNECHLRI
jgi:hypothetical protein